MLITEIKILTGDLKFGMYVSRLDRSWLETPYKIQGFLIKTLEDIDEISNYCNFVYVDTAKSKGLSKDMNIQSGILTDEELKRLLTGRKPIHYEKQSEFKSELDIAYENYNELNNAIKNVLELVARNDSLDLAILQDAVGPMVESVIRNPDAFSWLSMIKAQDDYVYNHSISAAIWAAAFGRNLGLPIRDIQAVSLGALLFDVGKIKLPIKLIQNPNSYNPTEIKLIRKHVEYGVEIVKSIKGIKDNVVEMVATHHERHNGSGYPKGLIGNNIPLFGKMAGIIDCYDAITSQRHHATAISPHEAVKKLYDLNGSDFQSALVELFIQVVGVYPVGTLVELSDGRIGVVVAHNLVRRLRPKIMLLLDKDKKFFSRFDIINLLDQSEEDDVPPLNIIKTIEPGSYGIDPKQFYI